MMQGTDTEAAGWLGLAGRVCVVTGAGSGIGAETARRLASEGAWVAVLDRDEENASSVAGEIGRVGGRAMAVVADVGVATSVAAAADRVRQELDPCRVLVNNAAIRHREPLMEIGLDAWNRVLAVPVDLANAIAFLASDRSDCISAQEVMVDGGVSSTLMDAGKRPMKMR